MTEKAKRRLSDIDFSQEGAHIALVSKGQGGPANKRDQALIMKAANFKPETVAKAQKVKVTMEMPDFLRKFFSLYYDDALVLATILGYDITDTEYDYEYYQEMIEERLDNFEFIQKAHDADDLSDFVSALSDTAYLKLLRTQSRIEKAFAKAEKAGVLSDKQSVTKTVQSDDNKENENMTTNVQKSAEDIVKEAVEKAQEQFKVELEKAQTQMKAMSDKLEAYAKMEQEAVAKAKETVMAEFVEGDDLEVILKAVAGLDEDSFKAVAGVMKNLHSKIEKSSLFREEGADVDAEEGEQHEVQKSAAAVNALLAARFAPK